MAHSYGLYFIIFIKHGDGTFTIYNHFNLMFPTTNIHGRRSLMGGMFDDTNGRNAHLGVSESGISTSTPFHPLDNHHVFLYMIIHVAENWQNLEVNPTVHPFCRYKTTSQALKSQELPGLAVHRSFRSPQVCIDLFEFWPWRTPEWWKNTTATRLGELLGFGDITMTIIDYI